MNRLVNALPTMLALLVLIQRMDAADEWPMLAHDPARSGATADEIRPPFERKWYRAFPEEGINAGVQPIVASGMVLIPTLHGTLHAIDAKTGQDRWTFKAPAPLLHTPAADGGKIYIGCADGNLYALNLSDGAPAWHLPTGAPIWNAPAIWNGLVVVGSRDGRLYAADAASGQLRWSAITGGPIVNSPSIDPRTARVYVGSEDMHLHAFDLPTGRQIWQSPKLPGASLRGYYPVIAPDGSVMVTTTPIVCSDTIQQLLLDMVHEVFGDFASWRHKKEENDRLRKANFELLQKPQTYRKEMEYLRKRLTDQPDFQTFFVLNPSDGKPRFVTPIIHAESMNGPGMPPLVLGNGKVVVKYSALLRSRYEHYSPFLNVGYLDTSTGHITPIMDQSRTYGWYDSLLLVHDEMSQLSAAGRALINAHQDNVNAMDLDTLKGYPQPFAFNVHEVAPGTGNSLWAIYLSGKPLPVGWEWFARGTAVYGGGSAIDVPVSIAGDSFYFIPTHEINAGVTVIAYRMAANGAASQRRPEPSQKLTQDDWNKVQKLRWDWDLLAMPRLNTILQKGLPAQMPGTRQAPLTDQARATVARIEDGKLDELILTAAQAPIKTEKSRIHDQLNAEVSDLLTTSYRPLQFPAGKAPGEAFRFFTDPSETIYTLALAYPHLSPELQSKAKARIAELSDHKPYPPDTGQPRSLYDPAPDKLLHFAPSLHRSDTARLYPLYLAASATGNWSYLHDHWAALKPAIHSAINLAAPDLGNADLSGLIAACRIARHEHDDAFLHDLLPKARLALRQRLIYELSHTEGGLITSFPPRTLFGRWHFLTPDLAHILSAFGRPVHQHLMEVYVDHHRPTWYLAWDLERLWRNESNFSLPSMSNDIFAARALILNEPGRQLASHLDIPWCNADEYHIQKLALTLMAP